MYFLYFSRFLLSCAHLWPHSVITTRSSQSALGAALMPFRGRSMTLSNVHCFVSIWQSAIFAETSLSSLELASVLPKFLALSLAPTRFQHLRVNLSPCCAVGLLYHLTPSAAAIRATRTDWKTWDDALSPYEVATACTKTRLRIIISNSCSTGMLPRSFTAQESATLGALTRTGSRNCGR